MSFDLFITNISFHLFYSYILLLQDVCSVIAGYVWWFFRPVEGVIGSFELVYYFYLLLLLFSLSLPLYLFPQS